jgi:peptidoglycan/xylan/chitin deacetylase (PgdA/CDA1 family)
VWEKGRPEKLLGLPSEDRLSIRAGLWAKLQHANFSAMIIKKILLCALVFVTLACGSQAEPTPRPESETGGESVVEVAVEAVQPTVALPMPTSTPTTIPTPDAPPALLTMLQSPLLTQAPRFAPAPHLGVNVTLDVTAPRRTFSEGPSALHRLFVGAPTIGLSVPWATLLRPALAPTPDGVERTAHVPILMYHYLSEPPANADLYRRDLSVSPALFEMHLQQILDEGYATISLYDLVAFLNQGAPLPAKPVILTFDDGYRDNYENAFPLLVEYGMTATFFVVSDFVNDKRPEYLTWEMARAMAAGGMSIQAHGRNHVSLRGKDIDYLVWQALGSLETIEHEIGVRPRFISYPAGEYDRQTIELFHSANYWGGITTIQGATHTSSNLFELRRVRIRGATTPAELARLLALDW